MPPHPDTTTLGPGEDPTAPPTVRAFRGLTMLAVEDSRYAAEALRLMCRRLGLRLRRVEDLRGAHLHLRLYRPDVVLVDLGLPDGRGEALLREITSGPWRPRAVLATSGDPAGQGAALAAGADGFIDKPLENFATFRATLLHFLPELDDGGIGGVIEAGTVIPDPLALRDDLAHAAAILNGRRDAASRRYVAGFLGGVAAHAHDPGLAAAAAAAGDAPMDPAHDRLQGMLARRLSGPDGAFRGKG